MMYNRYIPQADGSYRRSRVDSPKRKPEPKQACKPEPKPECVIHEAPPCPPPICPPREKPKCRESNTGGFLQNLLPKDFDTGDLIVILLLLLMAGDCEESRNNSLLTLVLYLIL